MSSSWVVFAPPQPLPFTLQKTSTFTSLDVGLQSDVQTVTTLECRAILLEIWRALLKARLPPPTEHLLSECGIALKGDEALSAVSRQFPERISLLETALVKEFKRQSSPALFHQLDGAGDWDLTYEGAKSRGFCLKINVNLKIHLQDDPNPFLSLQASQQTLIR